MSKKYLGPRIALIFTCFTLSLFTCVLSAFIMQAVAYFHVSATSAGGLETYQNATVAILSFISFSFLLKVGYRRSLMIVLLVMIFIGIVTPIVNEFWMMKLFLVFVGLALVSIKVAVYSTVTLITENKKQHAIFITVIEATCMISSMLGMWILSEFIKFNLEHWMYALWFFSVLAIINFIVWCFVKLDESVLMKEKAESVSQQIKEIWTLLKYKVVWYAIILFFLASLVETCFAVWLPGFYQESMAVKASLILQIGSMFVFALAAGRIFVAFLLKYLSWNKVLFIFYLVGCILLITILITIHKPEHAVTGIWSIPFIALLLPLMGFFLAPSTPLINSSILTSTPEPKHALMMTIMTITFAISGSLAARLLGFLFDEFGGVTGLKIATVVPLVIMVLMVIPYARALRKSNIQ
ncbi:MAG TPA: MFS transporter [Victivallales bacterium]|nr:MFS transporter [Victivallales bacterium]